MEKNQRIIEFTECINRRLNIFKGFILTGVSEDDKEQIVSELMTQNPEMVMIKDMESPKALFHSLKELNGTQVLIAEEVLHKRKEWVGLIEQAVCSSTDSGDSWEVYYLNEGAFKFTGKLIILTETPTDKFFKSEKNKYLIRDCFVV